MIKVPLGFQLIAFQIFLLILIMFRRLSIWDIWEAVYSPQGDDGYPKRIFDKFTGDIDPEVASYWRENNDLSHILERDWANLGFKAAR